MKNKNYLISNYSKVLAKTLNNKKKLGRITRFLLMYSILVEKEQYSKKRILIELGTTKQYKIYTFLNIKNGLSGIATIEPEIYVQIQLILQKITDKYWTFDEIVNFLINWFVFSYKKNIKAPICFPFNQKYMGKRYDKLKKFNKTFKVYYKRMMHSWGVDKPN